MCSVIGLYSKRGEDVSQEAYKFIAALQHRGPQAFGVKTPDAEKKSKTVKGLLPLPKSPVVLGHCLLSTTGFGVQPLSDGAVSIAHNGQIYNYQELNNSGRELVSDSESIAVFLASELRKKSFEEALRGFYEKAEGEYAVGALHNGSLYAFRDLLGIKPLWFGENDSFFAFASEPAALMKIDIQFPRPLLPGHLLEISKKGISVKEIYSLEDFKKSVKKKHSISALEKEFERTMDLQCAGQKRAAVLFSGGVDSSLIAKAVSGRVKETVLFVAGVKGSEDLKSAHEAAKALGLPLEQIILSEKEVQSLAMRSMKILSFYDEMQVGLAVPVLACAERIAEQGFNVVFSGQGSDEIFCGYTNYANILKDSGYPAVEDEIWFSLSRMWSRNFYRDDIILASQSLELRVPFMARSFLQEAMVIPASEKILSATDSLRKRPVRALAKNLGLPDSIVSRPKKAMQYGSGVQKIVTKLLK
ncbi:MAG TPA: asparagine synthetase B [archaeon]|nr:asparagine synthetase B [archaeon]